MTIVRWDPFRDFGFTTGATWVPPVDEPKPAEPNEQKAGADLGLTLPLDQRHQQAEGQDHQQHCQQMADCQRPKCFDQGTRASFDQPG